MFLASEARRPEVTRDGSSRVSSIGSDFGNEIMYSNEAGILPEISGLSGKNRRVSEKFRKCRLVTRYTSAE